MFDKICNSFRTKCASIVNSMPYHLNKANRTTLPNFENPITRFNYSLSFQYFPNIIEGYNNGLNSLEVLFDKSKYPETTNGIASKVEITCNSSQKFGIDTFLITIPSTKAGTEVDAILIFHSTQLRNAVMYTLEYPVDPKYNGYFVICHVEGEKHFNTGINAKDGNEFFARTTTLAFTHFAELEKKRNEKVLPEFDIFISKVNNKFGEEIPKDIYGTPFTEESVLENIYSTIESGAEYMSENIDIYFQFVVQNKDEMTFCLAGAIRHLIDPIFTAYAIFLHYFKGESSYETILGKVNQYANMFWSFYYKRTYPLMAFAKKHGKMKIVPFTNSETGEPFKTCAFVDNSNNIILCYFGSIDFSSEESQTADFIVKNKNHLAVVQTSNGTYRLVDNDRLEDLSLCSLSVMIHNIFYTDEGFRYKAKQPIASVSDINDRNSDGSLKRSNIANTFKHVISEIIQYVDSVLGSTGVI